MGGDKQVADKINLALKNKTSLCQTVKSLVKYYLNYRFGMGTIDRLTQQRDK